MAKNLTEAAREMGVSLAALLAANPQIKNPNIVTASQLRSLNEPKKATVSAQESAAQLARVFNNPLVSGQLPGGGQPVSSPGSTQSYAGFGTISGSIPTSVSIPGFNPATVSTARNLPPARPPSVGYEFGASAGGNVRQLTSPYSNRTAIVANAPRLPSESVTRTNQLIQAGYSQQEANRIAAGEATTGTNLVPEPQGSRGPILDFARGVRQTVGTMIGFGTGAVAGAYGGIQAGQPVGDVVTSAVRGALVGGSQLGNEAVNLRPNAGAVFNQPTSTTNESARRNAALNGRDQALRPGNRGMLALERGIEGAQRQLEQGDIQGWHTFLPNYMSAAEASTLGLTADTYYQLYDQSGYKLPLTGGVGSNPGGGYYTSGGGGTYRSGGGGTYSSGGLSTLGRGSSVGPYGLVMWRIGVG